LSIPLRVTFRGLSRRARLDRLIEANAQKLASLRPNLTGGSLVIERPHEHEASGTPYRVRLELRVPPSHTLVAIEDARNHDLFDSLESIVNSAFANVERQLKKLTRRQRGQTKQRRLSEAIVTARDEAGGRLRAVDGGEFDFRANSVVGGAFEYLTVGTMVRFETSPDGLRPTTVSIVDKPGVRQRAGERPLVPEE
jgi:ribosome-associated translation inhibitor RaiA